MESNAKSESRKPRILVLADDSEDAKDALTKLQSAGFEAEWSRSVASADEDAHASEERKRLETQLLRAQRLESIGSLAGGIAHDLNNLLAPIVIGVDLLRLYGASPENEQVIASIEQCARRGADLVNQVLSFARGVEGSRVSVQLGHVVREVQLIATNTFPKNITLSADVPSELWPVVGDPTQLIQALLNLCVNARDAMPKGGNLSLAARNLRLEEHDRRLHHGMTAGRYVVVDISDDGCGMSRDVVERIFDPFFTTKEVGKGTGLGLSTVLGIVKGHGGFVDWSSELGKGSVFSVFLPVQPDAADDKTSVPRADVLPHGNGELILLVDDERSILTVTKQTLEAYGYNVITAWDGAQALKMFARHHEDVAVVLTDMMMPVLDGPALVAALLHINPDLPIIGASGLKTKGDGTGASSAGVKHFLAKPYTTQTLLMVLKSVLRGKR